MCSNKGVVKSISATLVANWNNLNQHGALKKKAAICRVIDILKNGDQILISKDLVDVFRASKKKDDMADAMLMGLSYTQWRDNSWNLLAEYPVYTVQTSRTTTPLESLQNVDHDLPMMTASIQKEDPQKINHSELSNNELEPPPDNQDSQDLLLPDTHKQPENNSYQGQTNAMSLVYAQSFIEEYINPGNLAKTAHRLSVSNENYFKAPQPYLMHIALQEFNRRLAAVVPGYSDISTEPTVSMPLSTTTLTDVIASGLRNLDPLSAPDMFASDGTLVLANLSGGERYRWFWNYHKKHFLKDGNSLTDLTECSWRVKAQENCKIISQCRLQMIFPRRKAVGFRIMLNRKSTNLSRPLR
ncbi:hypothetical protein BDR26DRAFT_291156 [Obelidium mucronatum]|nr:hypothetical protein BDR26DRAFT_291156 [Obelidium mucronatum]